MALKFLNDGYFAGKVGIGIQTPTSKLHINQNVTNPDLDTPSSFAVEIDSNHSGSDATTGDREQGGLYIDVDSSTTGGDTSDEHRLYGIWNTVNHSGDSDVVYGTLSQVEQNTTAGTTSSLIAVNASAISDGGALASLTNITGSYGTTSLQDTTPIGGSWAGRFINISISNRTGATTAAYGIASEIQIDSTSSFTNLYAGRFSIDSNAAYTATSSYLLYLDYQGTSLATNVYSIYSPSDVKSYHKGKFGIGTDDPEGKFDVVDGNAKMIYKAGSSDRPYLQLRHDAVPVDGEELAIMDFSGFNDASQNTRYGIIIGKAEDVSDGSEDGSMSFLTMKAGTATNTMTMRSGNVGINTTSPSFKLDVDGTFGVSDLPFNTDSVSVLVADETIGAELLPQPLDLSTDFTANTSETTINDEDTFTVSTQGTFNGIITKASSITFTVGNVYKLILEGTTTATNGFTIGSAGGSGSEYGSGFGNFEFTATHSGLWIRQQGPGETSFTEFSVKQVTSASNQIQKRELGTGAFGPTPVGVYLPLAGGTMTGNIEFANTVQARFMTSANTAGLKIQSSGTNSFIDNEVDNLFIRQKANDKDIILQCDDGSGGISDYLTLDGSTTHAYFSNPGNVGIGTYSPSAKLQVSGTGSQGMQAWFGNGFINNANYHYSFAKVGFSSEDNDGADTGAGFQFNTRNAADNNWMHGYIYQPQNGGIAFGTGGEGITQATERMRIDSSGKVGIGTDSPDANLEVESSTGGVLRLTSSDTTILTGESIGKIEFKSNDSSASGDNVMGFINSIATNVGTRYALSFGTGNAAAAVERMRIDNLGNVGIGTASPSARLDIFNGNDFTNVLSTTNMVRLKRENNEGNGQVNGIYIGVSGNNGTNNGWAGIIAKQATASSNNTDLLFTTRGASDSIQERMRVTSTGGISFGSTGTAYGSSGQILTSAGNASPTWETFDGVTGSGAATQVAFWDSASSLSGDNDLYWDSTNNHLGIGDSTPGSRLKVTSGISETSIYTVDINHVRNDADVATNAVRINMDLSGDDNTTADRTNSGIIIDIDSSANGDASNEHRIRGVNSDVKFSGFSDNVQGGYFLAESNYTGGLTAQIIGVLGSAVHDSSSTNGGVSNMYGVYGTSNVQDLGNVGNAFGGYFSVELSDSRGNADVGVTKGVEGHINIDKASTINYGAMTAVSGIIDNNEGAVPNLSAQYLFKGDYQGTKGSSAYGIYTEGDKHYFDGNLGIGNTDPTSKLTVKENGVTTKIATATIGDTVAGASLTLRGGSPTIYFDKTGADPQNKILMDSAGLEFKTGTLDAEGDVDFKINPDGSLQLAEGAQISNQENTNIDSAAAEMVAQVTLATYTAAFFDFVIKKGTNVRSGTVYACHDGTNVSFTETSTQDLGDTSDVVLSVDKTSTNLRLIATVASDDWSVKSLIRAI